MSFSRSLPSSLSAAICSCVITFRSPRANARAARQSSGRRRGSNQRPSTSFASPFTKRFATRFKAGDAKILGLEFGYRQSLTFLRHWARALQVFVNATKLELSGNNTADFTGFNPETYAGGINFVRGRVSIKSTISHLGDTRRSLVAVNTANGIPANTYNYQGKRTRIGVNAQYSLSKRYSLYVSVNDLGGFVQNQQRYTEGTPEWARGNRFQELGFYYVFGVRGSF